MRIPPKTIYRGVLLGAAFAALPFASLPAQAGSVTRTNIISDGAVPALVVDKTFINPWGMALAPGKEFWINLNGSGTSVVDNSSGVQALSVTVPPPPGQTGTSTPTGQVLNTTTGFTITENGTSGAAVFLFDTEDGTISGWSPSVDLHNGVIAIDNSQGVNGAVYKGLGIISNKTGTYLLAANFKSGLVEVYDSTFTLVGAFRDHTLPSGMAPFNVQVLNGGIYVTYAQQDADKHDDMAGPGIGMVERVDIYGSVKARVDTTAKLNSPWGLAIAPPTWGRFANALLVGNFGDGKIHVFDPVTLTHIGALKDAGGNPISIGGLWGLARGEGGGSGGMGKIYFTAGSNGEKDGVFGSLTYTPSAGGE